MVAADLAALPIGPFLKLLKTLLLRKAVVSEPVTSAMSLIEPVTVFSPEALICEGLGQFLVGLG